MSQPSLAGRYLLEVECFLLVEFKYFLFGHLEIGDLISDVLILTDDVD